MKMLSPMFSGKASQEDILAIMKRSYSVIFGKKQVYVREPSPSTKAKVHAFKYWPVDNEHDLLTLDGITRLRRMRKGDKSKDAADNANREWQLKFLYTIMEGNKPPLRFFTQNYYDDKGCLLDKVHVDEKPDIDITLPNLIIHANTNLNSDDLDIDDDADDDDMDGAAEQPADEFNVKEPVTKSQRTTNNAASSSMAKPVDIGEIITICDELEDELDQLLAAAPDFDDEHAMSD